MLSASLRKLTSTVGDENAWRGIIRYYYRRTQGIENRDYQPGEIVAIKGQFQSQPRNEGE